MQRLLFSLLILLPNLAAQEPQAPQPMDPKTFDSVVASANSVLAFAWPMIVSRMQEEMTRSLEEMGDGDSVRKLKVTDLKLSQPPIFEVVPCPGQEQCRQLRLKIPGDGKWSVNMSGEIVPPWQKNQEKFRKMRLALKDVSLQQDYQVDLSDPDKLSFKPLGPPQMTFRLTSPNLLYKAVLAAARGFIRQALEEVMQEQFQDMPVTELALQDMRGFKLDGLMAQMGSSLSDRSQEYDLADHPSPGEALQLFPLEEPVPPQTPGDLADDAFKVAFIDKNIDPFAESFPAGVDIQIPPGTRIEDVTFKLGTREIARLTQPPWRIQVHPGEEDQVLLATVTLTDGIQEDDYLFLPGRGHIEEFEVQLVDLFLNFPEKKISDAELRDLHPGDFLVTENGIPQEIAKLQIAIDRPLDLVMVVDMSGSMEGRRLVDARKAATRFIEKVTRQGDTMHLIAYNDKVKVSQTTQDRKQMIQAINRLERPHGATRSFDAVNKALDLFRDDQVTRVILLLTDGYNYGSHTPFADLKRRLEQENVLLYTVGIDISRSDARLKGDAEGMLKMIRPSKVHLQELYDMSAITGGRPFFIDSPSWLNKAFDAVEQDLRSQVRLGYYTNLPPSKKGWREIKVKQVGSTRQLHHKKGYWKE